MFSTSLIDVHHHYVPDFYWNAVEAAGGDPSGFPPITPSWTLNTTEELMDKYSVSSTILSITAPGPAILQGEDSIKLARQCNEYAASIRDGDPDKFGFFVSLPDILLNKDAALAELRYGLDVLHGDGVIIFSRYGSDNHYLGHPDFAWIWDELDARKAVVLVHPTTAVDRNWVSPYLPQPMMDYPYETTRTAVDLIVSDTIRTHRNIKIILAHAGGMLPWIAYRPAVMLPFSGFPVNKTTEEFVEEASSFYFDLALSTAEQDLQHLLNFAKPGHVMYGSDFPYAPAGTIDWFAKSLQGYQFDSLKDSYGVARGNAEKLFPRFAIRSAL